MRRHRRHVRVPPDLTSLFDVLFIVIFAALIRAAAVQAAAPVVVVPPAEAKPPPAPLDPATLKARALAQIDAAMQARPEIVVRVSAAGKITAIEAPDKKLALDTPLVEPSADPDVGMTYIGDRAADLRLCRVVVLDLGVDLAKYLVIVAPDRRLEDLPHALFEGLHRDIDRCTEDQHGVAALVEP
jgi:hypothetical protein